MKKLIQQPNNFLKYLATLAIFLICGNLFSPVGPTAYATIINVPADQPTIQAAVIAAASGDTIIVAVGTYPENVTINKTLTLRGAKAGIDARGRVVGVPDTLFESVISPVSGAPVELLAGSSSSVIDGFAMLGNVGGTNGVIQTLTAVLSSVQLKNNYLKVTSANGQALWFNRGITDVTIDKNEMVGGTSTSQVIYLSNTQSFLGMFLTYNNILGSGGTYGLFTDGNRNVGTSATPRSPLFQGNLFQGLVAGINAGSRSLQDVQVLENTFNNNTQLGFQGGPKNCNFARNTFTGNGLYGMSLTAFGSTDPLRGGQGTTIQNNFFSGNATSGGAFGDILLSNQTTGTQNSNLITNNSFGSVIAIYNNEPNGSTDTIHAECNWYGSASFGAVSAKIFNIAGGIVDFIPYLTNGTDDSLGTPGFQPVPGSCNGQLPPADDVGVTATNLTNGRIFSVGKSYAFTATVKNFGIDTQYVVPVFYTLNGGDSVGPVNTVGPILQGDTENVTFSGGFALTGLLKGLNTIKIYTALAADDSTANDTLTVIINVFNKITTYPYVETFGDPVGWTVLIEDPGPDTIWFPSVTGPGLVNPAGVVGDTAAFADFYNVSSGIEVLRSPEMDISSLSNPILHFYVTYKSFPPDPFPFDDSLEVVVSTDGGLTFFSATTVYNKGNLSIPSLATRPESSIFFVPDSARQWRHETIDLDNVSGSTNLVIGFRAKSDFGNSLFVDDVIVTDADDYCEDLVTLPGPYSCNSLLTVDFTTVGLAQDRYSGNGNDNNSITKSIDKEKAIGLFTGNDNNSFTRFTNDGSVKFNSSSPRDTGGGVLSVTTHLNEDPPSLASPEIAPNVAATNPSGGVSQPNVIYQDHWFTVTYTGNDKSGYAKYDILIDATTFTNTDSLYILKRADMTASWVCLNTNDTAGSMLIATYISNPGALSTFSDFAIGGDSVSQPLPVELSSFTSTINRRDVTLNWTTATELNNSGFDVERSVVNGQWSKVGFVNGNGTTTSPKDYSFTDRGLNSGKYNYRLKQIDFNGNFAYYNLSNEVNVGVPTKFDLSQNYPNPFNPTTKINYDLPIDGKVSIKLYDVSGREVATLVNDVQTAGYYTINFNGSNFASGVYFYTLTSTKFVATKKMMLVK